MNRAMMPMQMMRSGGPVVRGASPEPKESYGMSFEMERMGGTGIPTLSRGELDATLPVSGGVMSLHAEKPLGVSRRRGFAEGGPVYMDEGIGVSDEGDTYLVPRPTEQEAGPFGLVSEYLFGDLPSTTDLRESARVGNPAVADFYGEGGIPFEQVLTERYGYPEGVSTAESRQAREMRPRPDMPTYQELEDARAHALGTAILGREVGPDTAITAGNIRELIDRYYPIGAASEADVLMDKRNNAMGIRLLRRAGIDPDNTVLTQAVDQEIFRQIDRILGRTEKEQRTPAANQPRAKYRFKSPAEGIDVYFPRTEEGYFKTMQNYDGV